MKKISLILALTALSLAHAWSQQPSAPADPAAYAILDRGPHQRVWARVSDATNQPGATVLTTNVAYVELAAGLHYARKSPSGAVEWVESQELIESFPGGAVARHGPIKVIWANDLATAGAIDVELPADDPASPAGRRLVSHVIGLTYLDTSTGKSELIAEVKSCQGRISGSQVIYADAMEGLLCDVQFIYRASGLSQNIILRETPPDPRLFGMNPETTVLEVLTEFIDLPQPARSEAFIHVDSLALLDETLDFPQMRIGKGYSFRLGPDASRIPTAKRLLKMEQRDFLVEQVPLTAVLRETSRLFPNEGASLKRANGSTRLAGTRQLPLAPPKREPQPMEKSPELAAVMGTAPGFMIDYETLLNSTNRFTLKGDTLYYVSGPFTVTETLTIEPGAVVKFPVSSTAAIIASNVVCLLQDYSPAVFTAKDDNTPCYETISGSTGNPSGYYGRVALEITGATPAPVLNDLRFCFLSNAVSGAGITLEDAQVVQCRTVFAAGSTTPKLNNVLIDRANTVLANTAAADLTAVNVTARFCTNFLGNTSGTVRLTNSLFVCVTNWQCTTTHTNSSAFLHSDLGVFQTVGAGAFYLATESPYRNAGTSALEPALLTGLRAKTTYPPIAFSNVTFSADMLLTPQAQRDVDAIDQGYHYYALDYVFGGCAAECNVTFAPGTAAAWFRTSSGWQHAGHGIKLGDSKLLKFDGRLEAPTYWVRYNTVQECVNKVWSGGYGPGGITSWSTEQNTAEVQARFLRASALGGEGGTANHFRDDWGWMRVRLSDSEFYGGGLGGYISWHFHTNCLYHRVWVWLEGGQSTTSYEIRNGTWQGGSLQINRWANPTPVRLRDCVFDRAAWPSTDAYAYTASISDYNYNAFITGAPTTVATGANDLFVTGGFNWQTGPLGRFYLPSNSSLIDSGSVANSASIGLYHYTTQADLNWGGWQEREMTTQLDRGRHYIAVDADGMAIDSDSDGIPDYLEDANGNGALDSGETDPQSKSDLGLRVWITRPAKQSNVP